MAVTAMNHFTILTDDLPATQRFYEDMLGLTPGYRPPLKFPGAWMYCGQQAVLHVIAGRTLPEQRGGVLDHMAFSGEDLSAMLAKLRGRNQTYELRMTPDDRVCQLFFYDPNGARVEIDYAPEEYKAAKSS
jgi:catechol 2,3-dioxygenase-like lactoylglutathione lyase family enzyme